MPATLAAALVVNDEEEASPQQKLMTEAAIVLASAITEAGTEKSRQFVRGMLAHQHDDGFLDRLARAAVVIRTEHPMPEDPAFWRAAVCLATTFVILADPDQSTAEARFLLAGDLAPNPDDWA